MFKDKWTAIIQLTIMLTFLMKLKAQSQENCMCDLSRSNGCTKDGQCNCITGYFDNKCGSECQCSSNIVQGGCDAKGLCDCSAGFYGRTCHQACDCNMNNSLSIGCNIYGLCVCKYGFTGKDCRKKCNCRNVGVKHRDVCRPVDGICYCRDGFFGARCEKRCNCFNCSSLSPACDADGQCSCKGGFRGEKCTIACDCPNSPEISWCDSQGNCKCSPDKYGPRCANFCRCGKNSLDNECFFNGYCRCKLGWTNKTCESRCECNNNGSTGACDAYGYCDCKPLHFGPKCQSSISGCGQMYPLGESEQNQEELSPTSQIPWLVKILKEGKFVCSGAIILENWIITLSRCFSSDNVTDYLILAGDYSSNHMDIDERTYAIELVHHYIPDYEATQVETLALVKIGGNLEWWSRPFLSNPYESLHIAYTTAIQPICLPDIVALERFDLYMSGWGMTHHNLPGDFTTTIKMRKSLSPQVDCPEIDEYGANQIICAKAEDPGIITGCAHDYGSILAFKIEGRYALGGLWVKSESCSKNTSNYFINIINYFPWILQKID